MDQKQESLIEYPCDFPIKVMCIAQETLIETISAVALAHDPHFKPESIAVRPSSKGNYMGLTITVRATSREQLDGVYMALSGHPMVKMVL